MLGMSRSTTHRYVITLVALGYLRQGARRKYRLAHARHRARPVGDERDEPARARTAASSRS